MSIYAHRIVITRSDDYMHGRVLSDCTVYDADGNELCKLPITGYEERQSVEPAGKTAIEFWSDRVRIERLTEQPPTEEMEVIT